MRAIVLALMLLAASLLSLPSSAQEAQGCDGPPELCQQLQELSVKLAAAKAAKAATEAKVEQKVDREVAVEVAKDDQKKEERMAKLIAFAATLAVGLKVLLSVLEQWKGYFTTIRGKAIMKLVTITVGFVAFLATNIGLGIPWWQSLILAGGGPGALLVHDLAEIIPALNGKKQAREDEKIAKKVEEAVKAASVAPPPDAPPSQA